MVGMHKRETIFDQKSQECSFISWEMGTTTALTGWVLWILGSRHPGPCIVGKCFGSVLVLRIVGRIIHSWCSIIDAEAAKIRY